MKYFFRRMIFGIPLAILAGKGLYILYRLIYAIWFATAVWLGELHI